MSVQALLVAGLVVTLTGPARAANPRVDYALHCMGCHRMDGGGTREDIPAFAGFVGHFLRVPGGREFLVRVPGSAQSPLDDSALASVLNWILREFSPTELPTDFAPYTAEEVGRLRIDPLVDVDRVRAELIRQIEEMQ